MLPNINHQRHHGHQIHYHVNIPQLATNQDYEWLKIIQGNYSRGINYQTPTVTMRELRKLRKETINSVGELMDKMFLVKSSSIHGKGTYTLKDIPADTKVFDVLYYNGTTEEFRCMQYYLNHSMNANGRLATENDLTWSFISTRDITDGEELTLNYWHFPSFLAKPNDPVYGFEDVL